MNANATAQIRAVACLDLARALRSAQGKINKHRKAWIEAENEARSGDAHSEELALAYWDGYADGLRKAAQLSCA